jgi:hypothetical protein
MTVRLCDGGVIQPAVSPNTIKIICACGKSLLATDSTFGNTVLQGWRDYHRPVTADELLDFEPPAPKRTRRREGE